MTIRHNWGEDRVYFHDERGRLVSIRTAWTSLSAPDPFVIVAGGRAHFRVWDLRRATELIERVREGQP